MNEPTAVPKVNPPRSIKAIFLAARELPAGEERDRYLEAAVGEDQELRRRVERMLASLQDAEPKRLAQAVKNLDLATYEATACSMMDVDEHATIGPYEETECSIIDVSEHPTIGPYKIREKIAEGGMGVVYVAEQTEPVRRKVALKVIKPGMASIDIVARFQAERQALAMMDHPNIARVIDGGATENGQPYFVMELVQGLPITDYCDDRQLSTRERLELFAKVCRAVQHAHQKGIIHRDLKPSNVLVAQIDGEAVPKVIDFGVAKAISQKLTEQTVYTQYSQMIGTPLYMSPEQAGLSGVDVDTRSDVYSLGVLLYELISGCTPFDREQMRGAGYEEIRRIIREDEPPRPSTRFDTLKAADSSTISERRGVDSRRLLQTVKGELDWIVMKALEKDRNRRYETANGLAADLRRYLNDDPVEACPPSKSYRLRKYARRNKSVLVTAAVVVMSLLMGTGVSVWQAVRANEEAKIANAEAQRAEENLRLAMAAVDEMYTEVAESSHSAPRSQESRKRVLEKALNYYLAFAKINSNIALKHETAMAWRRVGEIYHRFEQNDKSQEALLTAIEMLQGLVNEAPHEPRYRRDLASTYWFLSKPLEVTSRFEDGEEYCRMAIQIQTQLVEEFPLELEHSAALAITYHQLGHMQKDSPEAIQGFTASSELFTDLIRVEPTNSFYALQLAHDFGHLGRLLYDAGKIKEAEETYRTSIELIGEASGPSDADVIGSHRAILGGAYRSLGVLLRDTERPAEAATAHGDAVRLFSVLAVDFPTLNYFQGQLGLSQIELGKTLLLVDRDTEAKDAFEAAYRIFAKLEKGFPGNPSYRQGREVANELISREELGEEPAVSK